MSVPIRRGLIVNTYVEDTLKNKDRCVRRTPPDAQAPVREGPLLNSERVTAPAVQADDNGGSRTVRSCRRGLLLSRRARRPVRLIWGRLTGTAVVRQPQQRRRRPVARRVRRRGGEPLRHGRRYGPARRPRHE